MAQQKPKLLEAGRLAIRARHYSRRTEEAYVSWIKPFIFFHGRRRRHHLHESVVQRAVKEAVRRAGCVARLFRGGAFAGFGPKFLQRVARQKRNQPIPMGFARTSRTQRRADNDGLHPRFESRRPGR